jgi:ABC-type lipoprotein release transport system permease subunit
MNSNQSLNILAENIFIDKIKNKKIPSNNIYKYWKSSREEAKNIIKAKKIMKDAPYCILIHNTIMYFMNIIISLIMIYILFYIYCIIYIIFEKN